MSYKVETEILRNIRPEWQEHKSESLFKRMGEASPALPFLPRVSLSQSTRTTQR